MKHPEWRPENQVQALGHLVEEAGEVLQQAGSVIRFGARPDGSVAAGRTGEDGQNNLQRLRGEISDLGVALGRVLELVYGRTGARQSASTPRGSRWTCYCRRDD